MAQPPTDPTHAFTELGRIRLAETDLNGVLARVAELAKRTLDGASEVSVTVIRGGVPHTAAFTGGLAVRLDEWQYEPGEGPCLSAAATGEIVSIPKLCDEIRWPRWTPRAVAAGAQSSLSIGLPMQDSVVGALNIYGTRPDAFDEHAVIVAQTFAGYAAVAIANAHLYHTAAALAGHLQNAMESRAVIEQAKGIIMGERRCTTEDAFAILSKVSQDSNRKLRDVAAALVELAQRPPKP